MIVFYAAQNGDSHVRHQRLKAAQVGVVQTEPVERDDLPFAQIVPLVIVGDIPLEVPHRFVQCQG